MLIALEPSRLYRASMQPVTPRPPEPRMGSLIAGSMLGACFVAAGLTMAFLALGTQLVASLFPGSRAGSDPVTLAVLAWGLVLVAGACLLLAGTNRLAEVVAVIRVGRRHRSPVVA